MVVKNTAEDHSTDLDVWKTNIRQWALELGFVAVGFTAAVWDADLADYLSRRMYYGYMTLFEESQIDLRVDPRLLWPDCRSVMALAYPMPLSAPPQPGEGVLSRSAVGQDYHSMMKEKLQALLQRLRLEGWQFRLPGMQVDTGPLNERSLAFRAGLGWIGRNQQLLVSGYGSMVHLALLLFDQMFAADEPLPLDCRECQACVQACPAHLLGEELFDPRRCLSYLTQSKDVLSKQEQRLLGGRIFGCDTCQEVCPHNLWRINKETPALELKRGVDLEALLKIGKRGFLDQWAYTAAGWRGKAILQRNAKICRENLRVAEPT
ncbi:MAG: tRNA epoxyqueuosine(34) reductase QueG [Peptococcaceae bacterium]|jgi:epoxyqueuosine reductase|nr:tRNA epoxyqueuosine(34) reductase QueG [Peptococcaceae bacterium]